VFNIVMPTKGDIREAQSLVTIFIALNTLATMPRIHITQYYCHSFDEWSHYTYINQSLAL